MFVLIVLSLVLSVGTYLLTRHAFAASAFSLFGAHLHASIIGRVINLLEEAWNTVLVFDFPS